MLIIFKNQYLKYPIPSGKRFMNITKREPASLRFSKTCHDGGVLGNRWESLRCVGLPLELQVSLKSRLSSCFLCQDRQVARSVAVITGLLYLFYPEKSTYFNMAVTESDLNSTTTF